MAESRAERQVLEFRLEDRTYCIDIAHVDEIVDKGELTPLPNADPRVEGVMDLRGTTATIVDPKTVLDVEKTGTGDRVVVLESDGDATVGWLIDAVEQVAGVDEDAVDESVESGSVRGVVRRDDEFVVWVDPDEIND